jgi:hypothetical protein
MALRVMFAPFSVSSRISRVYGVSPGQTLVAGEISGEMSMS